MDILKKYAKNYPEQDARVITIDCGIGVIKYIEPDNLKLQLLMQNFKEEQEKIIFNKTN